MDASDSLSEYARDLSPEQIRAVCAQYDLPWGPAPIGEDMEFGGGTASPKVILGEPPRRYLVRRRRKQFSDPAVVAFDHAVMGRLAGAGLPVYPPLLARTGQTAVFLEGWAFEVFPYIEGLSTYDQTDDGQLAEAGDLLGRFHQALEDYQPPGRKGWVREFHMATNRRKLEERLARSEQAPAEQQALAGRMVEECRRVAAELTDERVARLPAAIVHGDYTWANLMYAGGQIAGLFDFDWTDRQPRLEDLARAVLFLAFTRAEPLNADSIWELVTPWREDMRRARHFLAAYERHHVLTDEERALLPWYARECWLGCRIAAMRKVPDERKLEILTFGMEPILDGWEKMKELGDRN